MLFALDYLNRMERKYPGVLEQIAELSGLDSCYTAMAQLGVEYVDFEIMDALRLWRADKIIYVFEQEIAAEVLTQTEEPNYEIPVSFMKHLPYPCFAIHMTPYDLLDPKTDRIVTHYTGNAFVWIEENHLFSIWEIGDGKFERTMLDLSIIASFDDCFDALVKSHLEVFDITEEEIPLILRLLRVERFCDLTDLVPSERRLNNRLGEQKAKAVIAAITSANTQEQLLQRVIHIILYLNCTNADIESAEEKLKAGAWASLVGGKQSEHVPKTKLKQAIRENESAKVLDVGYRLRGKFKRSYSSEPGEANPSGRETGSRGYGKRRAHYHHFWVGPRKGPIAENIMNPAPGERGLVLYWLDATEIHPELRDDLATVVDVGEQDIDK